MRVRVLAYLLAVGLIAGLLLPLAGCGGGGQQNSQSNGSKAEQAKHKGPSKEKPNKQAAPSRPTLHGGTVARVLPDKDKVTVKPKSGAAMTFRYKPDKVKVELDGKKAEPDAIREGQSVTVRYLKFAKVNIARSIKLHSKSGKSGGGSSQGTTGRVIKTVAIKETEYKLSPSTVTLSKPGTYAFKAEDKGSTEHSLTIEGKGLKSEGGEATLKQGLTPGQSGVLTVSFQKSGTYDMYCPIDGHEQMGMKGKVVVK